MMVARGEIGGHGAILTIMATTSATYFGKRGSSRSPQAYVPKLLILADPQA
jgi:hypothetical protein